MLFFMAWLAPHTATSVTMHVFITLLRSGDTAAVKHLIDARAISRQFSKLIALTPGASEAPTPCDVEDRWCDALTLIKAGALLSDDDSARCHDELRHAMPIADDTTRAPPSPCQWPRDADVICMIRPNADDDNLFDGVLEGGDDDGADLFDDDSGAIDTVYYDENRQC